MCFGSNGKFEACNGGNLLVYNLIIVDDEILTINMLKNYIDWSEYNFKLCGCFSRGGDALEYVRDNTVHAIITDICIPDMDGLELAASCKKINPGIAVGFISSHRNFEYAFTAANMDTCGYILKPIIRKELCTLCEKLNEYVKNSFYSVGSIDTFNSLKFENLQTQLKCQEILSDILCSNLTDPEEINREFRMANIDISSELPCSIVEIELLDFQSYINEVWKHDSILLYNSISTLAAYNNGSIRTLPLTYFENKILVIAFPKNGSEHIFSKKLIQITEIIKENLINILKLSRINISITHRFNSLSELAGFSLFESDTAFEPDNSLIEEVLAYINENYANITSINSVADFVHFSPVYFGRYFAKIMNKPFKTYLNELKIEKAKELLRDSNIKTTAIATMLGFKNESYFYTVFKDITKQTPTQFRKNHRSEADRS